MKKPIFDDRELIVENEWKSDDLTVDQENGGKQKGGNSELRDEGEAAQSISF